MSIFGILIVLGLIFFIYIAKVIFSVIDLTYMDKNEQNKKPWTHYKNKTNRD